MRNEYNYYINVIKPIEKKYNRVCFLYSIFKFSFLKEKKNIYNKMLINYYKMLQKNITYTKKLEDQLKK